MAGHPRGHRESGGRGHVEAGGRRSSIGSGGELPRAPVAGEQRPWAPRARGRPWRRTGLSHEDRQGRWPAGVGGGSKLICQLEEERLEV